MIAGQFPYASSIRRAATVSALFALHACAAAPEPAAAPAPEPGAGGRYVYACADGLRFAARFGADEVTIDLGSRELVLPQAVAASGARFAADAAELWTRGDEATFRVGEGRHDGCRATRVDGPWEEARALGVVFRGVGQEPGWIVDLLPDRIRYLGDYGETRMVLPRPEPETRADGHSVFRAATEAHEVVVEIRREPCQDVMSGEPYSHRVAVRVDGRRLDGCGRSLLPEPLVGTVWSLVELDGAPAAGAGDAAAPSVRISADSRVSGSTGCNQLGGVAEVEGDRIRFGRMITTRRACIDSSMSRQEQDFLRMLESASGYRVEGGSLVLLADGRVAARFTAAAER